MTDREAVGMKEDIIQPNKVFEHIVWFVGRTPLQCYNGQMTQKLDVVTNTVLQTSVLHNHKTNRLDISLCENNKFLDQFTLEKDGYVSCWDLIRSVNQLKSYGLYDVTGINVLNRYEIIIIVENALAGLDDSYEEVPEQNTGSTSKQLYGENMDDSILSD